jgi:hypothetical protein
MRTKPSIADSLGKMRRSCSSTGGIISRGQDTPTRKNCGKVVATKTRTAVSRCLKRLPAA